jgi:2-C-methyl-D-erythritol 4-phosphate cytidylyltransferase
VIVVAAGRGVRHGGAVPKQFMPLGGAPVLLHALRPFTSHPEIAQVVVVLAAGDLASPPQWLADLVGDMVTLAEGGAERADSVRAGLAALHTDCTVVLVHDGARPFPSRDLIDAGIGAARHGHAAVPAIPVADTLKRATEYGQILGTVDRDGLWRAQTPQAFPRELLQRAHDAGLTAGVPATDDAMLVELLGARVDLIPGSPRNLKITTADDFILAEWYLGRL